MSEGPVETTHNVGDPGFVAFINGLAAVVNAIATNKIESAALGQPGGPAQLDSTRRLPVGNLPSNVVVNKTTGAISGIWTQATSPLTTNPPGSLFVPTENDIWFVKP